MDPHLLPLKKPKLEEPNAVPIDDGKSNGHAGSRIGGGGGESSPGNSAEEQEEALLALIAHRTHEVEHNKQRVSYYKSQARDLLLIRLIKFQ